MATKAEPKETSERYIQRQVVTFLRLHGWFVQIFSGSITAMPGLKGHPDLMATKVFNRDVAYILYVECKAKGASLRPSQLRWKTKAGSLLEAKGNVHYLVAEATRFSEFVHEYVLTAGWMR